MVNAIKAFFLILGALFPIAGLVVYPMMLDETYFFLTADFDKT